MRKELITHRVPKSPISEIFRTLRTNIQFMNQSKASNTLLITSTNAGEGKSWTTSNLSVAISQTGKRVIIIDGDMRKGRLHKLFGLFQKPGLSNYLSGVYDDDNGKILTGLEDYIQRTDIPNLDIMSSGNVPPNPSELLILPQMTELLNDLKQAYDYVIIDGTPCGLVTDSIILSRIVDSVIVVAACKETKKKDLQRVTENIKNVAVGEDETQYKLYTKDIFDSISAYLVSLFQTNNSNFDKHYKEMEIKVKNKKGISIYKCINESIEEFILFLFETNLNKLPIAQNIIICSKETSIEELRSFLYRAILCEYNTLFVLEILESFSNFQLNKMYGFIDTILSIKLEKYMKKNENNENKNINKEKSSIYLDSYIVFVYKKLEIYTFSRGLYRRKQHNKR